MVNSRFQIRRATVDDAEGLSTVLTSVVAERVHSAIDRAWTGDQQRSYLASLSSREVFHVAIAASGDMIGYQSLDLYSPVLASMAHVGRSAPFSCPNGEDVERVRPCSTRPCSSPRPPAIENWSSRCARRTSLRRLFTGGSGSLNAVDFAPR
jgi:hypothetical protein